MVAWAGGEVIGKKTVDGWIKLKKAIIKKFLKRSGSNGHSLYIIIYHIQRSAKRTKNTVQCHLTKNNNLKPISSRHSFISS